MMLILVTPILLWLKRNKYKDLRGKYCSVDPDNPLLPEGIKENSKVRVWRHDGKKHSVYSIKFREETPQNWLCVRMTYLGRKRLHYNKPNREKLKMKFIH